MTGYIAMYAKLGLHEKHTQSMSFTFNSSNTNKSRIMFIDGNIGMTGLWLNTNPPPLTLPNQSKNQFFLLIFAMEQYI